MPKEFYPVTIFLVKGSTLRQALNMMEESKLHFPIIAKPDVGGKGRMVQTVENAGELETYIGTIKENFLLQELVTWEQEAGIFYYRLPNEPSGKISGIVSKEFLTVTGNGSSTIEELVKHNRRYALQLKPLERMYGTEMKRVLPQGVKKTLVPYGNHARGSKFIDASHKSDDTLTKTIDTICKTIPGFYFGRLDIRFNSWEELRKGQKFSIIELNGSGSEPTHIYDHKHTLLFAWKEIILHWILLQRISSINHRMYEIPYLSYREGIQLLRANNIHLKRTAATS